MAEIRRPTLVGAELEPRKNGVAKAAKTALDYLQTQVFAQQLEMALPKFSTRTDLCDQQSANFV